MLKYFFVIFLIFFIPSIRAADDLNEINRLENLLGQQQGQEKLKTLGRLAVFYIQQAGNDENLVGRGISWARQANELARSLQMIEEEAKSLQLISFAYRKTGNFRMALDYSRQALEKFQSLGRPRELADCYFDLSLLYFNAANFGSSLENSLKALQLLENLKDQRGAAFCLSQVGSIFEQLKSYTQALEYFQEARKKFKQIGDLREEARNLKKIGDIYFFKKNPQKALQIYQEAIIPARKSLDNNLVQVTLSSIATIYENLGDYSQAMNRYQELLTTAKETGNTRLAIRTLNSITQLCLKLKKKTEAYKYNKQAAIFVEDLEDLPDQSWALYTIGSNFYSLRELILARTYLEQSLQISQASNLNRRVKNCFSLLSAIYEQTGDLKKALEYHKKFSASSEKIINEESNQRISEIQTRMETEKKQKKIEILTKDNEIQRLSLFRERFRRNGLIVSLVLLLIVLGIIFQKYIYLFTFWKKQKYIGQFRLQEIIGSGGMGTIFLAHSIRDKKLTAAIKVLRDELFRDESYLKRFKNEGTIIDKLEHPHIVKIIERGEYKQRLYIAMEYLQGKSLAQKIREPGPMPLAECLHIMRQITDAMILIHRKNIIHRDMKPENIMLIEKNQDKNYVKLLDFGLAKGKFQTQITREGFTMGTISYMSPEQLETSESSAASDIYSLGIIFYEMVTGQAAFQGEQASEIFYKIITSLPPDPITLKPDISPELSELIRRMIAKDPGQRPTAGQIARSLEAIPG